MNKEDILAQSRKDNKNGDEREKKLRMGSAIPAFFAMGVIGVILMLLELLFLDTVILSRSISLIFTGTAATQQWYLAFTLKKKVWYLIASFWTFSAVLSVLQVIFAFRSMM